ncbi:hypothetical protein E2C01_052384 [Portunus trituberculatus]|uniref:Uncharacterized protein n=1 Tax=Portunus trituberculatus TaxID=210409 RepID=A0A5B7GDJ1_PORTR|nr:hypothetical protein [Portunus trituberculatus]
MTTSLLTTRTCARSRDSRLWTGSSRLLLIARCPEELRRWGRSPSHNRAALINGINLFTSAVGQSYRTVKGEQKPGDVLTCSERDAYVTI